MKNGTLKFHKAHCFCRVSAIFLEHILLGCRKLLVNFQSSEKVDSVNFCQFPHCFCVGEGFSWPYCAILTMSLEVEIAASTSYHTFTSLIQ